MTGEVFASLPIALIAFASGKGISPAELLEAGELSFDQLSDSDALVPYECLVTIWELLLERYPDEPLGIQYADTLGIGAAGVVGYVCKHSRTLRDAMEVYARYAKLLDPCLVFGFETHAGLCRASMSHEARVLKMCEPIEMMVATTVRYTGELLGGDFSPHEVCFKHPQRHHESVYRGFFPSAELRFDAAWTGVSFDAGYLDHPFQDNDPSIKRYLEAHCDALLAETALASEPKAMDLRAREAIDELLLGGNADIEKVAKRLALSTRSLQRGLQLLETSFREQLDEVRRTRAVQLLRQRELSIQEVAFMLGYADPRNFYRSFKRWTDSTPRTWRSQH